MRKMRDIISKPPNNTNKKALESFFNDYPKKERAQGQNHFFIKDKEKVIPVLNRIQSFIMLSLISLAPLWFLPWGVDKVGLAKQLFITVFVGFGFLVWFYKSISKGKIVYKRHRINTGILLLLLAILLSTIFSFHPATSFNLSSANFGNLWNLAVLAGLYFLIANYKEKKKKIDLVTVFSISSGLAVFYALLKIIGINVLGGFTKIVGFNTIGTMNSVAILAGLLVIVCLNRIIINQKDSIDNKYSKKEKTLYIVILSISSIFLLLLNFSIVWYGLILVMLFMIIIRIRREKDIQAKSLSLPMAIIIISLVFILWGTVGMKLGLEQPQTHLKNLPTEVFPSQRISFSIANQTLNQAHDLKQTFFGVGLGNFNKTWLLYKPADLNRTDFWQASFSQGSSSFTTWTTETGYFGVLIMVVFLALILKEVIKSSDTGKEKQLVFIVANHNDKGYNPELIEKTLVIIYLIITWFLYPLNISLYFALFFFVALLVAKIGQKKEIDLSKPVKKILIFNFTSIACCLIVVFAIYLEFQHYVASAYTAIGIEQEYVNTNGLTQEQVIKETQSKLNAKINLLVKAYNLDRYNDVALRFISQYYLSKVNLSLQENKNSDVSGLVQNALLSARKAIEVNDKEYLNYFNLAQVYENIIALSGDAYKLAIDTYKEAMKFNHNDPSIYFEMARSNFFEAVRMANSISAAKDNTQKEKLIQQQNQLLNGAISGLNEAIAMKINYTSAYQLLAQIYDIQGKIDETITNVTNLVILNQQDAGMWFQLGLLYYKKGDIDKAETAFGQAVILKDDYSNARYFLGLVYSKKDKKTEAINQFEKVAILNPSNQEVQKIIENLKAGNDALMGIVPPDVAPEERTEVPVK